MFFYISAFVTAIHVSVEKVKKKVTRDSVFVQHVFTCCFCFERVLTWIKTPL